MNGFLLSSLRKGAAKIKDNPQLIYTVILAALITGSFIFMAERFIGIANRAQERLLNVRIGSLQDAFVSFARDKMDDPVYLNSKIQEIKGTNETIKSFRVIVRNGEAYEILASDNPAEYGTSDPQAAFLYSLAATNPRSSFTTQLEDKGERLFQTGRAITDESGNVLGAAVTLQTLSLADMAIKNDINSSRLLLLSVIFLVLVLFLRHSKIIDYMDLYKKLKEVDQLKDDFISLASHELRTPLTVIRGYAEFIKEAPEVSDQTKEYVSKIDISSKELDSLVGDILDVSRIEQGRMSFNFERIDPAPLISEVAESFVLPAKEKGLAVSFDRSGVETERFINADRGRLKQALVNIIGNAVKYTLKGEVSVKEYVEKNRLFIRVSDTGIGLTEEEKDGLFGKFYRVANPDTEKIRGTGLGLWITKKIIEEMNGRISVESIKGIGSHFIISFPLS